MACYLDCSGLHMLVYDMTSSTAEEQDWRASRYIRKWLGVPPGHASLALHSNITKLPLPFLSALEEYNVAKVSALMTLKQSRDTKVSRTGAEIRTGRTWIAAVGFKAAESQRLHKKIVGATTTVLDIGYH